MVNNNLARGSVRLDMALKGTGKVPFLQGEAIFDGMAIKLPNFVFTVDSGRLTYPADDPFTPHIALTARGRRQSYDVDVVVRGPVDDTYLIDFSSSPPLDHDALVVLVSTGMLPERIRQSGMGNQALTQVGMYLGQELYHEFFGSESTETGESFADRFDLWVGTEVGSDGTDNILLEYRLKGPWSLQLERDIYADMNMGIVYRIRFR
jgi:hypothetical protein